MMLTNEVNYEKNIRKYDTGGCYRCLGRRFHRYRRSAGCVVSVLYHDDTFCRGCCFSTADLWKKLRRLDRATIGHGIVTGIFLFLAFAFQTFGLKYSTPSKNAFLTAINVVFVPYLLWLLWHRRPSRKELIASLLCIVGIALLTLKKDALMLGFGDMLSLVCALFFALHIIALERYSAHVDTVCMTALQMMTAGVISTICALTLEQPPTSFNWHAAGKCGYLIFVSTLLAYLPQTFAQKFTTANSASLILSMEALFASIFSFLLLGEVMSPPMILGACLIFSSILYIEYKPA